MRYMWPGGTIPSATSWRLFTPGENTSHSLGEFAALTEEKGGGTWLENLIKLTTASLGRIKRVSPAYNPSFRFRSRYSHSPALPRWKTPMIVLLVRLENGRQRGRGAFGGKGAPRQATAPAIKSKSFSRQPPTTLGRRVRRKERGEKRREAPKDAETKGRMRKKGKHKIDDNHPHPSSRHTPKKHVCAYISGRQNIAPRGRRGGFFFTKRKLKTNVFRRFGFLSSIFFVYVICFSLFLPFSYLLTISFFFPSFSSISHVFLLCHIHHETRPNEINL